MTDAGAKIAVFRFLAMQLDLQTQVIQRVGVPQGILVPDLPAIVEVEQRLVESLHTQFARSLHHCLDLMHLTLENEVGNEW